MFFWNSVAFLMIQWWLTIWSLVPLPFLNPTLTSGISWFAYCWQLAWRILSFTLLVCEMSATVQRATHLEPDILECEVKWVLGSITTNKFSGGDGIPVEIFQILKDDAVKVLHSICQQIWKTQQWLQDWRGQFSFQSERKAVPKMFQLLHSCTHLTH